VGEIIKNKCSIVNVSRDADLLGLEYPPSSNKCECQSHNSSILNKLTINYTFIFILTYLFCKSISDNSYLISGYFCVGF